MKRVINDFSTEWMGLTMLCADRWQKNKKPFTITITPLKKTNEQLRYLHGVVLPIYAQGLVDAGYIVCGSQENAAKYYLKRKIGHGGYYDFTDGVVFVADSFEKADKDMLTRAIDTAIDECMKMGLHVPPPIKRNR